MFTTIVKALLAYMDKPWKVVSIVVMLILCLLGYIVYEQRADISHSILHQRPELLIDVYVKEALPLLMATDADVTQLVRVNLEENLAEPVAGYARGGGNWMPNPSPRPLVYEHSDPRVVISVIAGTTLCGDIPAASPLLRVEYEQGLRRICIIGVPPASGVTIGLIYLGWKTASTPDAEYYAKIILKTLSREVTSFGG